ncbi:MAG: TonB-dependent receptor [Xanthomonadales bacterium]|nr:TonB-dependent receptor [Xanthomonadales bacterium]
MYFRFLCVSILLISSYGAGAQFSYGTLESAIKKLTQSDDQIVYSNDFLTADEITLDRPINSIRALRDFLTTINFEIVEVKESLYLIKPTSRNTNIELTDDIVIGNIVDAETGYQIIGAKIIATELGKELAINDKSGFYFFTESGEKTVIVIKADGYDEQSDVIDVQDNNVLSKNYVLNKTPEQLENLYVTTSYFDFKTYNQANQKVLTHDELSLTPHAGNDPARAISKLPGINSSGLSARTHVRGGKQNESQVVLNGLALRHPYHFKDFFGIFSAINLSYVDELSIYAGVFPAKYGNYISSVMEIQSTDPSDDFFMDLSLGVLNSHVTFGESFNTDSQYLVSYRSGGDLFRSGVFDVDVGDPSYDDVFVHLQQNFSNGTVIKGNVLHAKDTINLNLVNEDEIARAKYIDNNYWFSIEHPLNQNVDFETLIFYQSNNTNRNGELFDDELQGTIFEDRRTNYYGFSSNIYYHPNDKTGLSLGLMLQRETTDIKYDSTYSGSDFATEILYLNNEQRSRSHRFKNSGLRKSLFGNLRYKFSSKFYGDFGLRFDDQDWNNETQISPRVNLSYFYNDKYTFRLGVGRHYQDQHIDGVLLEDENLSYFDSEIADIAIFEIQHQLNETYDLRTELYYKKYSDVQPYYENLFIDLHLHPELFSDRIRIEPKEAFTKGVDVTLSGYYEHFNWSASYSFSEAKDIIDGQEVLRSWDQQNGLKFSMGWEWKKWQFNSLLQYHSGWPRTLLSEVDGELVISPRNSYRNKDFLNLDVRAQYSTQLKGKNVRYWVQVFNILDRKNQCCSEYSYEENDEGEFVLIDEQKDWLPLIPSIGIDISF